MIVSARTYIRFTTAGLALFAVIASPLQAQFGSLLPRDIRNVVDDAQASDAGCTQGKKKSAGSRVLGGIMGRTSRRAADDTGISRWVPVGEFSDQLSTEIACRLDPEEQKLAAEATLLATRSVLIEGEPENAAPARPAVGSTATWQSESREEVSGTSTVVGRDAGEGNSQDCITVTDVVIIKGEETTANKRMCRPIGSRRYSIVA
ncbi:MAG: hypothetical protein WAT93_04615 [Pontixanthobacter sp.]